MKRLILLGLILSLTGCGRRETVLIHEEAPIYPDYKEVTVPTGIAPLNFCLPEGYDRVFVNVKGSRTGALDTKGRYARFNIRRWHRLLEQNVGEELTVTVLGLKNGRWEQFLPFIIHISSYPLDDFGITYRRMAPGYETYSLIGIYQRDIHSFRESAILQGTLLPYHCMGCHTANRGSADEFMFHLRGVHGATLLSRDGRHEWLSTKTDSTISNAVYTYWHPSGDYFACSTNRIAQSFWVSDRQRIEVYDFESDVSVIDVRTNEMITSPLLMSPLRETYPVFSPDGRTLYFCQAEDWPAPAQAEKIRYNLCSIPFDEASGTFGDDIDTVINAQAGGFSVTFPRPSYDGRWIMYCRSDFSCFPINRPEADLWLLDLETGGTRPIFEVNSDKPESFHNWSSSGHWFLFASRREDGMYGRVYFACLDDGGHVSKPFLLPQRNPKKYYTESLYSFNVPDFTREKVHLDVSTLYDEVFSDERTRITLRNK